jgi:hypothetical protein
MVRFLGAKSFQLLVVAAVVAAVTAGISYASIPDGNGVVHACYKLKDQIRFRLINAPAQSCKTGEIELDFYSKSGADATFAAASSLATLTATVNNLSTAVSAAQATASSAQTAAAAAQNTATSAQTAASTAQSTANVAVTSATAAQASANNAQATATSAKTEADTLCTDPAITVC